MHHDGELERVLNRSADEISYPPANNCCGICVQRMIEDDDHDGLRPSQFYHCVRMSCVVCTGGVALITALVWFMGQHHASNS